MKIVITDTNILFDVIKIGALPEFFSLDYEICTTVFVMQEITFSTKGTCRNIYKSQETDCL